LLSDEEVQCTPEGQVMKLQGARSTYDLNRDIEKDLAVQRKKLWAEGHSSELLENVRQIAGIRKLTELPEPKIVRPGTIDRDGYKIEKMIIMPEEGIYLPALMFKPSQSQSRGAVLYLNEEGKSADAAPGGAIEELVKAGKTVLAVDLRGIGETQQGKQGNLANAVGPDWKDVFTAYLVARSYLGMRAEDVLVCARLLQAEQGEPVELVAKGNVGVPALHAAALEPQLFEKVQLTRCLTSWSDVIRSGISRNQQVNAVHGVLKTYDLPNLAAMLGDKLSSEEPLNALGEPL